MKSVLLQPSYLPWMGVFGMIDIADVFIFYDDVQFMKKTWQQRNKIKLQNRPIWLTVPVLKKFGQNINKIKINNSINWTKKHWEKINQSYRKAPYFENYNTEISQIYNTDWDYLCDLNIHIIKTLSELLMLDKPKFMKSSDIKGIDGKKTDRIVNIYNRLNIDEDISGPAAKDYIDLLKLKHNDIKLYWYEFNHPVYPQIGGDFIPYLSIIDLLFNTGEKARYYLKEGYKDYLKLDSIF
jgi:hypothetical protein